MALIGFLRRAYRKSRRPAVGPTLVMESLESRQMLTGGQLTVAEIEAILNRASAATPSNDGIIAVVDRRGAILGVRTESGINTSDINYLAFAIDGAVAKARSAAFFSSGQGILTSRTVGYLSQSTITQREAQGNPNSPIATLNGPGWVAPVGVGGQFPPGIINQPLVDLFAIEHSNRVSTFVNGQQITNRDSYGVQSGRLPGQISRGIGTLPGGLPIYRSGTDELIGGIGTFFPGPDGFATFEQGFVPVASQTQNDRRNAPRVLEAELISFLTLLNGSAQHVSFSPQGLINIAGVSPAMLLNPASQQAAVNKINAAARINLGGIALQSFGPKAGPLGVKTLFTLTATLGPGTLNGTNQAVTMAAVVIPGVAEREGWIVGPTAGTLITKAQVIQLVYQGVAQSLVTRAQIRIPTTYSRMIFAVTDTNGALLGLYRMPDALCDALDVTPAKARNSYYYASNDLQPQDQIAGIPKGTAFTTRTFRYLASPFYPSGNSGAPPGPFSILNEPGIDPATGYNIGAPKPAASFQTVLGFDSFNPGRNFSCPTTGPGSQPASNQNGTIFFPGSSAVYNSAGVLIAGFGGSGDGVDQDDVVTFYGVVGLAAPIAKRADQYFVRDIRLPYTKFSRNAEAGPSPAGPAGAAELARVLAPNNAPHFIPLSDVAAVYGVNPVVTLGASDRDNDPLTYSATLSGFSGSAAPATLSISGNQLTVAPKSGFSGSFTVNVTATDGLATSDVRSFRVTVSPLSSTPPFKVNPSSIFSGAVESFLWLGRQVQARADRWIVRCDTPVVPSGLFGSQSAWRSQSLNAGGNSSSHFVALDTSGTSRQDVMNWVWNAQGIAAIEPDFVINASVTPNDPSYPLLWGLNNTSQFGGTINADIDAPEAWNLTTGSRSVVIGVIDSGVDITHPDLAANIWTNPGEIPGNGIDDEGNGYIDDVHGWDFVDNDNTPQDGAGHGTHVAGTIGAVGNNSVGVAGVNWQVSLMPVRFLGNDGSGSTSGAIAAINYATMLRRSFGINVVATNNSWGGGGYSSLLEDAIRKSGDAGITFVAAAGNEASDNDAVARYPTNYNLPNVISVAAIDDRDALASFSNYGATTVDIGAPGVSIYSTLPNNSYGTYSGTSMATPHVAGVIGLLAAAKPGITVAEVRAAIFNSAVPIASLAGKTVSGGRLNAKAALESLGMSVQATTPAVGSVVSVAPASYTIDFSQSYAPSSVSASDFTVNAIPASSFVLVDANTIRFSFTSSPVTAQGSQTMAIAAGAITRSSDSQGITAWSGSFFFDPIVTAVTSVTPANGSTVSTPPTSITFVFNEPLLTASITASQLDVSVGSVTGVTVINPTTVSFGVNLSGVEGTVKYSIPKGTLFDSFGSPNQEAITGSFTVDDPYLERYSATGLPRAIPDTNTLISQSLVVSDSFVYSDINVEIDISHTWDGDLEATLVAPDGTAILLFSRNGSANDNFTRTVFDSEASTLISAGVAPFTGRYQPLQSLAPLYNKNAQGTWQLQIRDLVSADVGTLNTFALVFARTNTVPSLAAIADVSVAYGLSLSAITLVGTDSDSDPLTYAATIPGTTPSTVPATVSVVGNQLTIVPATGFVGSFTVSVTATDGKATSVAKTFQVTVTPLTATLPFTDNFNRANSAFISGYWTKRNGDFQVQGNALVPRGGASSWSVATLNGVSAADVSVEALVNLAAAGNDAGVIARYSGPGDRSMYMGTLVRTSAGVTGQIWKNVNGAWSRVGLSGATASSGTLRLDVIGSSLTLSLNGTAIVSAKDSSITAAGAVGLRSNGTGSSIDSFTAS